MQTDAFLKERGVNVPENGLDRAERSDKIDLTIFVPCFNEERLIERTLDTIREATAQFNFTYEVLLYDDASTDRTAEVIRNYILRNGLEGRFILISNEKNAGIGVNYFRAANRGRGAYFIVLFGDNAEPAEAMRRVFNLMGKADVIIPYFDTRLFDLRLNGDNRSLFRRFVSITYTKLVNLISGHNLRYFNGFVLHRRVNVLANASETYGLGYQSELLCKILDDPAISYLEVKVFNKDRQEGSATAFRLRNIISVFGSLCRILRRRIASTRSGRWLRDMAKGTPA